MNKLQHEFDEVCVESVVKLTQEKLKTLGKNVKTLRKDSNLTQADVAFYIFSDKSLISALERGCYKNITLGSVVKIALLFGTNIQTLLEDE